MMAHSIWSYNPSPAAALLFGILFSLATTYHAVVCFRRRAWHFIPIVIGGICVLYPKLLFPGSLRGPQKKN